MLTATPARLLLSVLALALAASSAPAQLGKDRDKERKERAAKQAAAQKAQPAAAPAPTAPIADQVLKHDRPITWKITATVDIDAGSETAYLKGGQRQEVPRGFNLASAALVFPALRRTASSQIAWSAPNQEILAGKLSWNEKPTDARLAVQDGYAAGARLARFEIRDVQGVKASLALDWQVDCFDTLFDEDLAATIPWPNGWPPVAQSALAPQLFIEHESPEIRELVKKWTDGADPKTIKPVELAKFLAARVMDLYVPIGTGLIANPSGSLMGFDLRGARAMASDGRGSPHDLVCLLVAVYRAAGLPARVVIGIDTGRNTREGLTRNATSSLRSWAEFCLVDPFDKKEIWIPIDIARLRRNNTKAPDLDRPWKYLGTHDELSEVVPVAFQFHPPTTVQARAPMFWGWTTNPPVAQLEQSFRWNLFRAPRRSNERTEWRKD